MTCNECPYYYQGNGEDISCCHYYSEEWLDGIAPCERDE